ncbi:MAG: AraC family transcriptional regulator [Luteolibacter sp.]
MTTFKRSAPPTPKTGDAWWGDSRGLRCGRVTGRTSSAGWRWRVSSEGTVWLWLNREGSGLVWGNKDRFVLKPGMYAITGGGKADEWSCVRYPGNHQLEVVVLSREWLRDRFGKGAEWLHPELGRWLEYGGSVAFCGLMGVWEKELCEALERAAAQEGASQLLAEAKILEWAATRLYRGKAGDPGGGFCTIARGKDPVRKAIEILRSRVDQPLDLTALAKEVGVAPHHLSRRVSQETGKTLQRHLRRLRVERACEALASGKMNVTEVALEVGYQSLSHFAKAFREEMGVTPSEWLGGRRLEDVA